MLKNVLNGFLTGVGFCAGVTEVLFLLTHFWPDDYDWGLVPPSVHPEDVSIVEHRDVRVTEYYTVSGLLGFDDRSKYESVTVLVKVYQEGGVHT